ncbi:MAG: T9SS type A sorting domain-containing protein [Ignavibacteria bacterium]|nr:T9SS type A sorting domain-containing protein [Ignavibacteria bacterium]
MRNLKIFFTFFTFTLVMNFETTGQYFLKTYDLPPSPGGTEYGYSVETNYTVAGVSNSSSGAGSYDWMFLRLNSSGAVICSRLLGFSGADSCFSHRILSVPSRNLVLAGFYRAPNGYEKASFSMVDTNCNHLMSRQILDSLRCEYRQVVNVEPGFFALAGYTQHYNSPGDYKNRILVARYNNSGSLVWAFKYMPPFPWVDERAYSIVYQPSDTTYAICGITNRFTGPGGVYQAFVMKVSGAGIPIWYVGYSPVTGTPSEARRIIAISDGGFVIAGSSTAFDPMSDVYIFRISSAGVIMWSNTYGAPGKSERSFSIITRSTILPFTLVYTGLDGMPGTENVMLGAISATTGAPIWNKVYPNTSGSDAGFDLKETTSPGGVISTGRYYNSSASGLNPYLLRTDDFGSIGVPGCVDSLMYQPRAGSWSGTCARNMTPLQDIQISPVVNNPQVTERVICGIVGMHSNNSEIPSQFELKQNYPNPFNPFTNIRFDLPKESYVRLVIYDILGRVVSVLADEKLRAGEYRVNWDATKYSSGIYFYRLTTDSYSETRKMIVSK